MSAKVRPLGPPLLGLFRELLDARVPLGVRDYLDGLRALQLGFGGGDRNAVRVLAQALWARTDEERRLIDRYLDTIPPPPTEVAEAVERSVLSLETESMRSPASGRMEQRRAPQRSETRAGPGTAAAESLTPSRESAVRVSFSAAHEGDGLVLPRVSAEPDIAEEYALQPQALVTARDLAVLWRRYRRAIRQGRPTELDLPATVRDCCRKGCLSRVVRRPRRTNRARLLVLADVSPSMEPWRPFLANVAESLHLGRFALARIRYFANLPRRVLCGSPDLTQPVPLEEELHRFERGGLLVVSDAGSARGFLNRRRAIQTGEFLARAAGVFRGIVWLNPMPKPRWTGTTAALIAGQRSATALPLDTAHLLLAIDILRGAK